jgi:predicted nucleotidyltransferase
VFYSSDIDIIISDEASKNRAHGLLLIEELKIYKKDYFIEVPSILFSVHVICEKEADNTYLITAIYEVSRIVSPSL